METVGAIAIGTILLGIVFQDVFEVLLLPRRVRRRLRFAGVFFRLSWSLWRRLTPIFRNPDRRAAFLSIYGPLSVVTLYLMWDTTLILGFGFCQWGFNRHLADPPTLLWDLYLSGSTFFTLGFGDVIPRTNAGRLFSVIEAGSGFGLIAAVIGYLPVLYQLFARREAHIIQLDARAGSPPSATSLLAGHADGQTMDELDDFLRVWEVWGAELLESHLSYPMLVFYRSQHDNQSWLAALTTIMDSCALILSGLKHSKTFQARMTFAMCRMVVIEMARVLRVTPDMSAPDRLPPGRYAQLAETLASAGLHAADAATEGRLAAFRATYEPFLVPVSQFLLIGLPDWLPSQIPDNWQRSAQGDLARRLIDEVPPQPSSSCSN
jgi:hypothetical protein